ncbi:MAG: putative lipid II flippase FtsW [Bradymonadia bacterium]
MADTADTLAMPSVHADTMIAEGVPGDTLFGDGLTPQVAPPQHRYDRLLLVGVFALIGLGMVMVYSASSVTAFISSGDGARYLNKQLMFLAPALCMMMLGALLPHHHLKRLAPWMLWGGIVLLALVLVPGVGVSVKGARRWINLGVARFQPSELIKVAFVIYLASWLSRNLDRLHSWRQSWLPNLAILVLIGGLLAMQPDIGSGVICGGMLMLMLIVAGARWRHVLAMVGPAVAFAVWAVLTFQHLQDRLQVFLDPDKYYKTTGYQISQALTAFGSGGWTGVGLGASKQKMAFLPDAHTDFVFSILGEELGWVGAFGVILLFAFVVWRGWVITQRATTDFSRLLAFGLTAMLGFQAATNMAVVMALVPTKGLTLPFVSYGGSSLLLTCWMAGMLLNISRRQPPPGVAVGQGG